MENKVHVLCGEALVCLQICHFLNLEAFLFCQYIKCTKPISWKNTYLQKQAQTQFSLAYGHTNMQMHYKLHKH